jgi:hypothetical protein
MSLAAPRSSLGQHMLGSILSRLRCESCQCAVARPTCSLLPLALDSTTDMHRCRNARWREGLLGCARRLWSTSSGKVRGGGLKVLRDVVRDCFALRRRKSEPTQNRGVGIVGRPGHLSADESTGAYTSGMGLEVYLFEDLIESGLHS